MENKGLLFIPDISGFTRFINVTEIDHSRMIIQELLEILINSNVIGLEISEIEGDAILFYKFGDSPDFEEIYKQVERMFCEFNQHLLGYEYSRYCQCRACTSAIGLKLKVITHYGEFASYRVKNFNKLIGKDVIVAHQLLKNEIELHEYWLVTNNLKESPPSDLAQWIEWNSSVKQTEIGQIPFHYTQLGQLKTQLTPESFPLLELTEKSKMFSLSKDYDTDIITLFHATGDFNYRHRWLEGVKKVEEVTHYLPRVGMKCRCILESGEVRIYSSSYSYTEDRIEFSETDENRETSTYYLLTKITPTKTNLTISYYLKKNPVKETLFKLTKKKKLEDIYRKSMENLVELVKEIHLPPLD